MNSIVSQKLTAQHVTEIANYFTAISKAIGEFCEAKNKTNELSDKDNENLSKIQWDLADQADQFYTLSAVLVMDDVASSLVTIKEVTTQMQSTYKTLKDIQKAIFIATSAIKLGTAIISANPQAIGSAIEAFADCVK